MGGEEKSALIHEKTQELDIIHAEIDRIKEDIELLTDISINPDKNSNIEACKNEINKTMDNIGKADYIVQFIRKCDLLNDILNKIYSKSMDKLKGRIIQNTNLILNPIFEGEVLIDSIEKNIRLKKKTGVSEGQQLTLSYAYLCSLFKDSSYELPFVIDSPCGSLDLKNRSHIAEKVPPLFKQLVFLITSSERQMFTDRMILKENIHPYTIEKLSEGSGVTVSESLEVFNNYQSIDDLGGED